MYDIYPLCDSHPKMLAATYTKTAQPTKVTIISTPYGVTHYIPKKHNVNRGNSSKVLYIDDLKGTLPNKSVWQK